jgi:DtxR family transcriptional regulator, Mn-dependent transcriptional regulator
MSHPVKEGERMNAMSLTPSLEDYIETIYELCREKRVARVRDIVRDRGVKSSTVTSAFKRLNALGLIQYEKREYVYLTEEGEAEARRVISRHDLLSHFFASVLMMPKKAASEEACVMEHCFSDAARDRLVCFFEYLNEVSETESKQFLEGFRQYIESGKSGGANRNLRGKRRKSKERTSLKTLAEIEAGQKGEVVQVGAKGAVRQRLLDMGLIPGSLVNVDRVAPTGDPIWIRLRGYQLSLRLSEARSVIIVSK